MSAVDLELERALGTRELDLELLRPRLVHQKLLELSSRGLLEANPEKLPQGGEQVVADPVPCLEEGLLGGFPDQQSDRLDKNMSSSN